VSRGILRTNLPPEYLAGIDLQRTTTAQDAYLEALRIICANHQIAAAYAQVAAYGEALCMRPPTFPEWVTIVTSRYNEYAARCRAYGWHTSRWHDWAPGHVSPWVE
jgi:hypothetical protein